MAYQTVIREGVFDFDHNDPIYNSHFPGNPVVPGSIIIKAFMEVALENGIKRIKGLENFRFKKFIAPGEHYYSIEIVEKKIICRLYAKDMKPLVTGTLHY